MPNPYDYCKKDLGNHTFYDLNELNDPRVDKLPFSIKVLLESAIRNCDNFKIHRADVENIINWKETCPKQMEIPFKPARVILQDFTGVPAVVDLAAMRDAMSRLGGNPDKINPLVPVDLVIDHSVQVDVARSPDALAKNTELEFARNKERFEFLKWGATAFDNMLIVPPGSGIVHQVNLEYLARGAMNATEDEGVLYPDSLVGTDSHTTMIDGLGIVGWGVGGLEAESVMLGQPMSMVLPPVVGFKLMGKTQDGITATDLVLTCVAMLRKHGVVGKFVEFYGEGAKQLSVADRATIANMSPEYGATMGFFPPDSLAMDYMRSTGRKAEAVDRVEAYLKATGIFISEDDDGEREYSSKIELELNTVVPCLSGPKRPHDRVALNEMKADFNKCLMAPQGFKGFGMTEAQSTQSVTFPFEGKEHTIKNGAVVIAAITSCTNTSNPSVMLGAALVCKKAAEKGLTIEPYVKTSLAPGSGVVTEYLEKSGLMPYMEQLGFYTVGFGCTTCIGNSGDLMCQEMVDEIASSELAVAAVLSGNRNFEGRVHPLTKGNYLASPPLVVVYAIAGTVDIDLDTEPIGNDKEGNPVFMRDIWPSTEEVNAVVNDSINPGMFTATYEKIKHGNANWQSLEAPAGKLYSWKEDSTYIQHPPFFQSMNKELPSEEEISTIKSARCILNMGDSITTDHISPAGNIAKSCPAQRFLEDAGVARGDFNSYGSRRGNDKIMARGTFANIRIINKLNEGGKPGPRTLHVPSGQYMDIFDASMEYKNAGVPLIVMAGAEYGSGSSRDWAAKGPYLQGIKLVIAKSFERIHRSNLVGMGIIPCCFKAGEDAETLGLDGTEEFDISLPADLSPGMDITVAYKGKTTGTFNTTLRLDTGVEITYFKNGGILHYVLRQLLTQE